jgi:Domain of unknown function (DUF4232)
MLSTALREVTMRMTWTAAIAATTAATAGLLTGCTGTLHHSASSSDRPSVTTVKADECRPGTLKLSSVRFVPMTQEHGALFAVTSTARASCWLKGYPSFNLFGATGRHLTFRHAQGGGAYVTTARPKEVVLAPRQAAYVLLAKTTCTTRFFANAITIKMTVPGERGATVLTSTSGPYGIASLVYCTDGSHDPGNLLVVSPFEATAFATSILSGHK